MGHIWDIEQGAGERIQNLLKEFIEGNLWDLPLHSIT